jgi:tetratricopeptide (TPR) repeat protein
VKVLPPDERARLQAQVGEIAFLMAMAIHFQPNADSGQALRVNQLAERHLGDDAQRAVAQQLTALNRPNLDPAEQQRVREQLRQTLENAAGLNAAGRFLLACEHAAEGRHQEALRIVDGVVAENPNDFGAWSLKARCHQLLDQDAEAVAAYGTAIALRPTYARAYLGRASVLFAQQTRAEQARQDLDQALKLQPNLMEAHIDRGLVLMALGRHKEALQDLDVALQRPDVPSRVWFIRSRVHRLLKDQAHAEQDFATGLKTEPADPLSWVSRGIARLQNDVDGALADFIKAEEAYPRCLEALNNQAFVYAVKLKTPKEAIAAYDRLLVHFPDNHRALGHRAILFARMGKADEAVAQARRLMKMAPKPEHVYRAACALALASEKDPAVKNECLGCLANAVNRGYGFDLLETDKHLNPIRQAPEFKQFIALTRMVRKWSTAGQRAN